MNNDDQSRMLETPMETFQIDMKCCAEGCDGRMRSTGRSHDVNPPMYPHDCDKCGASDSFGRCYPDVGYRKALPVQAPVQSVNGLVGHVLLAYTCQYVLVPTPARKGLLQRMCNWWSNYSKGR